MVKDKGLACKFVISAQPAGAPVTERAIPVTIFSAEESVKRYYLRKWMREDPGDMDPRSVIDWEYYTERLGSVIQKLITIPAALQKIHNPVPRVAHPDWLQKRIRIRDDGVGIQNAVLVNGHPGHWGLTGMRERAQAIRPARAFLSG